jgi:cell division protein FtsW (lipid II flippase)
LYRYLGIVHTRVDIWWDPWSDAPGTGYQLIQGLEALAAGGVIGTGLGLGAPVVVPAVHTDFIFAAVAEELGLAGATAILMLYALVVLRGFRIAVRAKSPFAQLLAAGLTFALAVQTLIIVGGVVKLIPLTGITLPLLSHGGTSMLVSAVMVGLLLRVSLESG